MGKIRGLDTLIKEHGNNSNLGDKETLGVYELQLKSDKEKRDYERVVSYLMDFEADNRTLSQIVSLRPQLGREGVIAEVTEYVDSGLYRKIYRKLMDYDGLFAFKVKRQGGLRNLRGEMEVNRFKVLRQNVYEYAR